MTKTIHLDLRNLDRDTIESLNFDLECDGCRYSAPCIIGTLMDEDDIEMLQSMGDDGTNILDLVKAGIVSFPDGQKYDAYDLQMGFDIGDREKTMRLAESYFGENKESDDDV